MSDELCACSMRPDSHPHLVASYVAVVGIEVGLRFATSRAIRTTPTVGALRSASDQNHAGIQGATFSERLPEFHQLDMRIDKTWTFNRWKLGLYLDIQNLYNRANTERLGVRRPAAVSIGADLRHSDSSQLLACARSSSPACSSLTTACGRAARTALVPVSWPKTASARTPPTHRADHDRLRCRR